MLAIIDKLFRLNSFIQESHLDEVFSRLLLLVEVLPLDLQLVLHELIFIIIFNRHCCDNLLLYLVSLCFLFLGVLHLVLRLLDSSLVVAVLINFRLYLLNPIAQLVLLINDLPLILCLTDLTVSRVQVPAAVVIIVGVCILLKHAHDVLVYHIVDSLSFVPNHLLLLELSDASVIVSLVLFRDEAAAGQVVRADVLKCKIKINRIHYCGLYFGHLQRKLGHALSIQFLPDTHKRLLRPLLPPLASGTQYYPT
jgi:hypothetical protein